MSGRLAATFDTGRSLLLAAGVVWVAGPALHAQAKPSAITADNATFDVASIRENIKSVDGRTHIYRHAESGQFLAVNASMRVLIQFAFDMPDAQILNGPSWLGSKFFDVDAKADSAVDVWMGTLDFEHAKAAKEKMLQALFADRFHLVSHRETRELPVYALVVAKGGATLQPSQSAGTKYDNGRAQITDQGASIAILADQLSKAVGRPVIDKTGTAGRFDLTLKWTPDSGAPSSDPDGLSIFTAVQEQLGLKLEPAMAPIPVLVIDHVEMPSAN
jgi:uncharacterized protein (TIGR03435 family)